MLKETNHRKILFETYRSNGELQSVTVLIDRKKEIDKSVFYVPKWCVVLGSLGCFAILLILLAALVVVYFAPRPGLYQESCEKRSCLKELALKCINKTCVCEDGYMYIKKCEPKKLYKEKCHLNSYCKDKTNMVCRDGVCKCIDTKYWNGYYCVDKGSLNKACTNEEQCLTDSMLYCDTTTGKCSCASNRFWDGYACILKRTLDERCLNDLQCMNWKNLICISNKCSCNSSQYWDSKFSFCSNKLSENETCTQTFQCFTPMNCTTNRICQCGDKEYHDASTLTCKPQKTYGLVCSVTYNCRVDQYLECRESICQCISDYPTWSTDRNKCILLSTYSKACLYQSDCDSSKSLICNTGTNCSCPIRLANSTCDCIRQANNEYYWSGTKCLLAISYNQPCSNSSTSYMCKTLTEGTICSGPSPFLCKCPAYKYFKVATSTCTDQVLNDVSCSQVDECRADLGLSCQLNKCSCNSTQFWNSSKCINYYTYNSELCTNDTECNGILICKRSGSSCQCPSNVANNKCDCPAPVYGAEYYWNNVTCVSANSYGESCTIGTNYTCKTLTEYTYCNSSGRCDCIDGIFNGTRCNTCKTGWKYINGMCYAPSSAQVITYGVITSAAIQTACRNTPEARLAKLNSNAIYEYLFSVITNAGEKYFVNAYYVSGATYKSQDGTWTIPTWCTTPNSAETCCIYKREASVTSYCFESHDCSNHDHYAICEYPLT